MANLPLISLKHSGLGKGSDQLQSSVLYKDSYVAILCPSSVLNIQFYAKVDKWPFCGTEQPSVWPFRVPCIL